MPGRGIRHKNEARQDFTPCFCRQRTAVSALGTRKASNVGARRRRARAPRPETHRAPGSPFPSNSPTTPANDAPRGQAGDHASRAKALRLEHSNRHTCSLTRLVEQARHDDESARSIRFGKSACGRGAADTIEPGPLRAFLCMRSSLARVTQIASDGHSILKVRTATTVAAAQRLHRHR